MSGRSAIVRKKITETKSGGASRSRAKSSASSDNATISDFPMPATRQDRERERERERERDRDITGVGTTNARFLKFSEPARENEMMSYRNQMPSYATHSSGSQSGSSLDGRREATNTPQFSGPLEDFAYARARRPVIKTEDVSGIEKSGLRSMLDKKSDEVRKGLAKTFAFKKKDKKEHDMEKMMDFRPQSAATVRGPAHASNQAGDGDTGYDADSYLPVQHPGNSRQHPGQPWDESGSLVSPPPSTKLPPVPQASGAAPIKRWIGAGRPVQRWNKLRKDPELWDPNGDVLVFFGHKGQSPRPNPSFRLSSHIIEATESRYLITLLREGSTEEDVHMPPSPIGAPPMLHRHGGLNGHYGQQQHLAPHSGAFGRGGPTPPISEDASLGESDGQISYEMYFPTPSNLTKADQLRHHITTRNVFALLYHASLVGLSLYQALADLHARLESYMPPEADNVGTILNYISARGIDDVRNDAETALGILAWSEGTEVRWEEGWRESFLHCAGMYSRLETCADFKHVTPITRALLERASLETQLRVQAAEERLADFQYGDMWPPSLTTTAHLSGPVTTSPARSAADRLQRFFLAHYTREFGQWPPLPPPPGHDQHTIGMAHGGGGDGEEDMWLTRTVAQSLQKDFAALYDYLVNRDIMWDGSEARSGRKWMMVSKSGNQGFEADTEELPMTDMLIEFDNKLRFPHIPHPYPLVPESIPPPPLLNNGSSQGGGKESTTSGGIGTSGRSGAMERRIQLAYTEATNICIMGQEFTHSELIDAFGKFEKTDRVSEVDPSTARRGRWVLIYGILQTLASVSVDAPNVRYRDHSVTYHLSPRLKGARMPPWKGGGAHSSQANNASNPDEAAHELSHCWTVPRMWNAANSAANSGAESSGAEDGGGGTSPISPTSPAGRYGSYHFPTRSSRGAATPSITTTATGYSAGGGQNRGYYTPGARSVRSSSSRAPSAMSGAYAPFSSGGSVFSSYSESDAGSSSMSLRPPSSATTVSSRKGRQRDNNNNNNNKVAGTGTRNNNNMDRVDEHHDNWSSSASQRGGYGQSSDYQPAPLSNTSAVGNNSGNNGQQQQYGGFLMLDKKMMGGSRGYERSPMRSSAETDNSSNMPPVIRDFDFNELDVIDDHEP
ncbi:hypothetical protein QBC46DRAFT_325326 [Diplogelasinospora grovesii]|uniref:DUF8004 domain-containing protein n=1 Tax=Diplogelasinospora grovesii TaxID=303347 RepID=A0AAN6MYN3_9PEZI|nr:hypothetical protein QBC46DRAFT_325326 [Diplogelasinospora grovesii]